MDHIAAESAAGQSHHIDTDYFRGALDHVAEHVGRKVLADFNHPADHRVRADGAELVRGRTAADNCIILKMHVAGQLH